MSGFNCFEDVIAFLESFTNLEKNIDRYNPRTYRVDRMKALLSHLGNPEETYIKIHVAGSKGKGSVAALLASGMEAAGMKCALYMSPHLTDYRERFTLAGKFFPDKLLIHTGEILRNRLETFSFKPGSIENSPTTFELYTAFAFLLFKEARCDAAVIETGLGGRLDATNAINPIATVLTPIELEHTAILGDTIEKIATEKSKIIKPGKPVFVSFQKSDDAIRVFKAEAAEQNSEITLLSDRAEKIDKQNTPEGEKTRIHWRDGSVTDLLLSLAGSVQADNAALALLTLKSLGFYRPGITEKALEKTTLPGRFERISEHPPVILDGAHTFNSLSSLIASFREVYRDEDAVVIFGSLADKDTEHMSSLIASTFRHIIVARPGTYKKSNPESLYGILKNKITNSPTNTLELHLEAKDALRAALAYNSPILVTGSFYLAGEVKRAYDELNAK